MGNGTVNTSNLHWTETNLDGSYGHNVENSFNVTNSMISTWPSTNGTYSADKGGYVLSKETSHWNAIFGAYKEDIRQKLGVEELKSSDVTDIILTPFKVSRYNKVTNDKHYHVDCTVEVKCDNFATATFKLWNDETRTYKSYSAANYRKGTSVVFPKVETKPEYTFSGWYLNEDLTGSALNEHTIQNNVTFYAKCTPKTYTVIFNAGDHGKLDQDKSTVTKTGTSGTPLVAPETNPDNSYEFVGWVEGNDTTVNTVKIPTTITKDVTYTATWREKTYTVTFNAGDNGKLDQDKSTVTKTGTSGTPLAAPATNPNNGYKFAGWVKNSAPVTLPNTITEDATYTATWTATEPSPTTAQYTVKHYKWDTQNKKYTLADTDVIDSTVGTDVTARAKDYTDYTLNTQDSTLKGKVMAGNKLNLDLYYDIDKIGSGNNKDKPDKIPDRYQVTINYVSSNTNWGSVNRSKEVITLINTESGKWLETGRVTAPSCTATSAGGKCYFVNWTKKQEGTTDVSTVASTANLPAKTFDAKGGDVYTFTANFDRSSGGGSGGSNRPKPPVVEIPDDVPTGLNGKDHYAYIIGYGNNDVRPQNNITRAEVATIFFRLLTDETREANMTKSNSYNDVKDGDWFCCAVSTLSKMGIIKGYEDGSFKPNDPISRAEFAAIAARFDPDGDKTPASFSDVTSHWAKDEISIAANHGWIKGYEDGSFKPDQKITRAETMTLVNRVLNRLPETKDDLHKDMKTWVDNMDETAWYYLAVQEATNSHYFKNKTSTKFEQWTDLRDTRDWSELEK